ncbi:MAG TPA: response regulator [Methanothrix sp.]|nr:response regulator [Methanothrix sp.]
MTECRADQCEIGTVLLVEDEQAHAEIVRRVFEEDGSKMPIYHVECIGDAEKWLQIHKKITTPLVISDYNLPDGNGLELAGEAATPEEVGFPLIILTGVGSEKLAVRTIRSGALDYVVKNSEELSQLPKIARHVIREWNLIMERKYAENELKNFIKDLDEANSRLEDLLDGIARDLDESISSIHSFSSAFREKYAEKMDDAAINDLNRVGESCQRANELLDRLFEYVVPIYFDSSLIEIYSARLNMLQKNRKMREEVCDPCQQLEAV